MKSIPVQQKTIKLFEGRTIVVASMHGKELVMEPLIWKYLGIEKFCVTQINTDEFGTFSGEVERTHDPLTTLRHKIILALETSGETLGIGNEGSFGAHPQIPFIPADHELVMLIDLVNHLEIVEGFISIETNHDQREIKNIKELIEFADKAKFPSHGLILKQVKNGIVQAMQKSILHWEALYDAFLRLHQPGAQLIVETDMRAHLNPMRMKVIQQATEQLMRKVTNQCPECRWPGFGIVEIKKGLPCKQCKSPTQLPLVKIYQCVSCNYTDERYYTSGEFADPQYCDQCNP